MADILMLLASGADGYAEPSVMGLDSYQWVALAMSVLLAVFVWKKVPSLITGGLDTKIALIRASLEEAKTLRAEAEALRNEYAAKIASAEKDAEMMLVGAREEGDAILARAQADSEVMVARRQRMAEDKIAAAERTAIAEVKASAVTAAAAASRKLIAQRHDSAADRKLADEVIALDSAIGRARLSVPGIVFDKGLQPEDLTELAKGVIAFADGAVAGNGRIDWNADTITSSGIFTSDGMDFAAAFGPVRGLKGRVVFTDLLNLTTAPDQKVTIAAINPGIEVLDGAVQFEVRDGTLLTLEDARFPFMGGELQMRPLAMDFSQPEERRYVFEITGLDAATFVAQMELTNLGATGTFDGTVPIIFDKDGNGRIEGGLLLSRAPGGNVAYIGELTYEDLGTMGNYAFSALRSMDYTQMQVGLNGNLAGEIITNFDFDGVRQGAGTSQNFITRRLAKLPIRFKINVRAENFYELTTMVRSFWDVDFLGNPVDRGLLRSEDGRFVPARPVSPTLPLASIPVQPSESDEQP